MHDAGSYYVWELCLHGAAAGSMATVGSISLQWWRRARSERSLAFTGALCWSVALTLLVGAVGMSTRDATVFQVVVPVRAVLIGITAALFIATLGTLVRLPAVRAAVAASVLLPVIYAVVGLRGGGSYTFIDGSPWPQVQPSGNALVGLSTLLFVFYAARASIALRGARRWELAAATASVIIMLTIPTIAGPGELTEAMATLWTLPIAVLLAWLCTKRVLRLQGSLVSAEAGWRQAESAARYQARHDQLTGLPNRDAAVDTLQSLLDKATGQAPVVVTELQVGRLEEIQVAAGLLTADMITQTIACYLVSVLPPTAQVARVSESSFVVLASLPAESSVAELPEQTAQAVALMRRATSLPADLVLSVGIAVSDRMSTVPDLLRDAGTAVMAAEQSQGRVQLYRPELKDQIVRRARLTRLLSVAVDRDEFELHYQPVLDTVSHTLTGVEALVRWRHHGKLHQPAEWIPIAEQRGLMPAIGLHVLRLAARDHIAIGCPIAVNISACQLNDPGFAQDVLDALRDIDPRTVILEVTESAVMADLDQARGALATLRGHGIRIALDDFGTEYSSLSRLASLPFDILKIDRSFVADVTTHAGRAIVTAIKALAVALGKTTVAEGIETREQLKAITEIGCDNVQGFLTGRPMPLAELLSPAPFWIGQAR